MTVTLIVKEGIETEGEHYKWQLKGKEHVCLLLQPKFVLCKNIYVDEIFNDFFFCWQAETGQWLRYLPSRLRT